MCNMIYIKLLPRFMIFLVVACHFVPRETAARAAPAAGDEPAANGTCTCTYGPSEFMMTPRRSIPGYDINCGQPGQSYCRVCGGVNAVADSCDGNPNCASFDMEDYWCGYLKAEGGKQEYTEGFANFCKMRNNSSKCSGSFALKRRSGIIGADISCNQKNYDGVLQPECKFSSNSNVNELAAACKDNPKCAAFTTSYYGNDGYLKGAGINLTYGEGNATFVKV